MDPRRPRTNSEPSPLLIGLRSRLAFLHAPLPQPLDGNQHRTTVPLSCVTPSYTFGWDVFSFNGNHERGGGEGGEKLLSQAIHVVVVVVAGAGVRASRTREK